MKNGKKKRAMSGDKSKSKKTLKVSSRKKPKADPNAFLDDMTSRRRRALAKMGKMSPKKLFLLGLWVLRVPIRGSRRHLHQGREAHKALPGRRRA